MTGMAEDDRDPDQRAAPGEPGKQAIDLLELNDQALLKHCEVHTYRASGPGGQKRNKTDSAVRLRLAETGLVVVATESRSQHENRARALRRLRHTIALEMRRPVDPDRYEPGPILRTCLTRKSQLQVGMRDARYPHVVREILDLVAACSGRLSDAAPKLGISTANLSALLVRDDKLLQSANRIRLAAGLKRLKR